MTEKIVSTTPKARASEGSTRPCTRGRFRVRAMMASMSRSYHMLMAPAPPAATAMQSTATAARKGWMSPGATSKPASPVKTTRDMTRGFNSAMKSRSCSLAEPAALSIVTCATFRLSCRSRSTARSRYSGSCDGGPRSGTRHLVITASADVRQLVEGVEWRRRRNRPLQRRRAFTPVVRGDAAARREHPDHHAKEEERRRKRKVGAKGGHEVPARKGVRIVDVAARHALQSQEVLREEGHVHADEGGPKVQTPRPLRVGPAAHLADPVVDAAEDREDGTQAQHIVKVGHHIVGVMQRNIDARVGQHYTGDATHREEEDKADRPEHRRLELDGAAPHRGNPAEYLDARRHGDDQCRSREVGAGV